MVSRNSGISVGPGPKALLERIQDQVHVVMDRTQFFGGCRIEGFSFSLALVWRAPSVPFLEPFQHGSLFHQSIQEQKAIESTINKEAEIFCNLTLTSFVVFCWLEASYWVQAIVKGKGLHKSVKIQDLWLTEVSFRSLSFTRSQEDRKVWIFFLLFLVCFETHFRQLLHLYWWTAMALWLQLLQGSKNMFFIPVLFKPRGGMFSYLSGCFNLSLLCPSSLLFLYRWFIY